MSRLLPAGLAVAISLASLAARTPAPAADTSAQSPIDGARQLLLVVTSGWDAVNGTLERFERGNAGASWNPVGLPIAVVVGRSGLAWGLGIAPVPSGEPAKREGDGKAPAGVFGLGTAFGQSRDRPAAWHVPYLFLANDVECVDDAQSAHYNRLVTRQRVDRPDWTTSERMWAEPLYKWGVVVGYNPPPARTNAGSCIFLHIWRGPDKGTAGCTAMSEAALLEAIAWLDEGRQPMLVQLPRPKYERLKTPWRLPTGAGSPRPGSTSSGRERNRWTRR